MTKPTKRTKTPVEIPATVEMVAQPHGGALRRGGTNKGAGRPPNEWKARMRALADRWAQAAESRRVLDDPDHPQWMNAGRFVAEQAHGKPKEGDSSPKRIMRFVFVDEVGQRVSGMEIIDGDDGD